MHLCMCAGVCIKKMRFMNVNFKLTRAIRYIMNILISLEDLYSFLLESLVEASELNRVIYTLG